MSFRHNDWKEYWFVEKKPEKKKNAWNWLNYVFVSCLFSDFLEFRVDSQNWNCVGLETRKLCFVVRGFKPTIHRWERLFHEINSITKMERINCCSSIEYISYKSFAFQYSLYGSRHNIDLELSDVVQFFVLCFQLGQFFFKRIVLWKCWIEISYYWIIPIKIVPNIQTYVVHIPNKALIIPNYF